jgi:hypothetical protein
MSDEKKSNILAVIERNQSEMLRRLEVIEHKLGIASYSHTNKSVHSRPGVKLVRQIGDYCPAVIEVEYTNEMCYLCGQVGTMLTYEQHDKLFGELARCANHMVKHGQKENNDSAESDSVSTDSDSKGK